MTSAGSLKSSARSARSMNSTIPECTESEELKFKKLVTETKADDGKSIFMTCVDTIMLQDVKGKKGDVHYDEEDAGLACLSAMVTDKEVRIDTAPLEPFGASIEDLLRVFVKWSYKASTKKYNISKAFRRFVEYSEWMERNCKGFDYRLCTMADSFDAWGFFVGHDKSGRLVWYEDFDQNKVEKIKNEIPHDETLKYFTYLSHLFMFDEGAQEHGMVCVEQMGNKNVVDYFTMFPVELGAKLDRISCGILPVKVKKLYMYNYAGWMFLVAVLLAPFTSPKMRKRVAFLRKDPSKRLDEVIGLDEVPKQMKDVNGKAETDILAQLFMGIKKQLPRRNSSADEGTNDEPSISSLDS